LVTILSQHRRPAGTAVHKQNKNSGWSSLTLRCLLTHRLFSSRQTVFGKLMTFSARRNMHMDIIPMHISHIIMVTLRFMSAFLLAVIFPVGMVA
jgi:hypothetical protein